MKIREAEKWISSALGSLYPEGETAVMADMLLEHVSGYPRTERMKRDGEELTPAQQEMLAGFLERMKQHEPVQYILKKSWFYGLELYVDHYVLIPRPETEELVDWIIKDVKNSGTDVFAERPGLADETRELKVLDVGTGSGCIALALKKGMPRAEVWGCDASETALNVARRNGSTLNIRVDFQGIDFLDAAQQKFLPTVHIIVSNPPYIPKSGSHEMGKNVVAFEPHMALFVPDNDPLVFYRSIASFSRNRLYPGGFVYVEIHEGMGAEVSALFRSEGFEQVELKKDMQGKDRMIRARKGPGII
jgi:release factor glutamine methyltransferase